MISRNFEYLYANNEYFTREFIESMVDIIVSLKQNKYEMNIFRDIRTSFNTIYSGKFCQDHLNLSKHT